MASAAPPYHAADAPPAYHEVVGKLNGLLGDTKSPRAAVRAASTLSDDELRLLADYSDKQPLNTGEQEEQFRAGIKATIASDAETSLEEVEKNAETAAKAAVEIDALFTALNARLVGIDEKYKSPEGGFADRLKGSREKYRNVLENSRVLATVIAQHAEAFDQEVIKLCADESVPVSRRVEVIEKWIEDAKGFADQSSAQSKEFRAVKDSIHEVFVHFATWAEPRFKEIDAEIKELNAKIAGLDKEIESLTRALELAGMGAVAGLLGAAIFGILFGPVAIIGGLIVAGVSLLAGLGILIALQIKKSQRDDLKKQKTALEDEKKNLQSVRDQLRDMAEGKDSDVLALDANVMALMGFWGQAQVDAVTIQGWLRNGADQADLPKYMEQNLKHGVEYYNKMAKYLTLYAKGIAKSADFV